MSRLRKAWNAQGHKAIKEVAIQFRFPVIPITSLSNNRLENPYTINNAHSQEAGMEMRSISSKFRNFFFSRSNGSELSCILWSWQNRLNAKGISRYAANSTDSIACFGAFARLTMMNAPYRIMHTEKILFTLKLENRIRNKETVPKINSEGNWRKYEFALNIGGIRANGYEQNSRVTKAKANKL